MVDKNTVIMGVATVAAAVAGATAAHATDLPSKSSPKAPAPSAGNWDGFYVGGSLNRDSGTDIYWDADYKMSGAGAGAFVGFNHQMGNLVVGAEVAGNMMSLNKVVDGNYSISEAVDAKARLGFDMNGILMYAVAGGSVTTVGGPGEAYHDFGINVGAGAEMKVTHDVSVGLEYLHRMSQRSYAQDSSLYRGVEANTDSLSLRAAYHF